MENFLFVAIMALCGLLLLLIGGVIWRQEKITLIHDYHYRKVKEQDKKAYTAVVGKGLMVMGAGVILSGVACALNREAWIGPALALAFVLGLGIICYGQFKYNHGIF